MTDDTISMAVLDDSGMVLIPDKHVLQHVRFHKDMLPFGWHVFVLDSLDTLQQVRRANGDNEPATAYAWMTPYEEPDAEGSIGTIYFVHGNIYVGVVAHEALHLASWMCRFPPERWRQQPTRRMTLGCEPEELAEYTGAIAAIIWYNLEADGLTTVDSPED